MAAILQQCQRGREDRRKAKKRKRSCSKNIVCWCLNFFLPFVLPGAAALTLEGQKGGSITLPCNLSNREDLITVLTFGPIIAYGVNQDKYYQDRVNESGSCDLILQDLKTTDAGKYTSKVFANSQPLDSYTYDVHVKVNLTGLKGEELMFDELPREAKNVTHLTNADWTEVWSRERGVLTDRLTDKNGRLTIKNFSSSDAGIYRVLNSTRILITITVTESSTGSKDKLDGTHEDEPHDRERVSVWIGIGVVVVLVALIVFAVIKIRQYLKRNEERNSYQGVQMKETAQGPSSPNNNSSGCLVCLQCQQICRGSCQHIIPDSIS